MSTAEQILSVYDKVVNLLGANPHLRDDDAKLIATIWLKELGGQEPVAKLNGMQFLHIIANNQDLTSPESITRARRKAQEENLHLRGKKYLSKFNHQEQVKEFIHNTQQ